MSSLSATVILSSYNGEKRLPNTLDSFVRQDLPKDGWEIIAVDNNSSDRTFEILQSYADRLPIKPFRHVTPGKSSALNEAIARAQGELLVFTDDDVEAAPHWLGSIVECAQAHPEVSVIGGRIVPNWERPPGDDPLYTWLPLGSTFAIVDDLPTGPCDPSKIWGPNTTIRASALGDERYREDIGPLPAKLYAMGEDSEIVMRLAGQGHKAYHCAEAEVRHFVPASNMSADWVQKRAERLGFGIPALQPEKIPGGPRLGGVPVRTWLETVSWGARSLMLYPLPKSRLRFWAIWKLYYMRGLIQGIRHYMPAARA